MDDYPINRKAFWITAVIGGAAIVYGIIGLFLEASQTHPGRWSLWFGGVIVAHDLVIAPVVLAVGILVRRKLSPRYRAPVQGALLASAMLFVVGLPALLGYGKDPVNPSVLPANYFAGALQLFVLIWAIAVAAILILRHRSRKRGAT